MDEQQIRQVKQRYGIIGDNGELNRAIDVALQVARTDLSVLVTGENGSGKEMFPQIIHDHSARKTKRYLAINCGSIPEGTIDSELFGHVKGSFTGALEDHKGYFEAADGGTLFLDEVGELPLSTQARLLRVLETGEFISVGSSEVHKVNVRIIAATNVNIPQAIADRRFREDLYYRLNTVPIMVPPLRERGDDIVLLFRKFAMDMKEKYRMPPLQLSPEACEHLKSYAWPGNVRQLKNVTENLSVTSQERLITSEALNRLIPLDRQSTQLIAPASATTHTYEAERQMLLSLILDLRKDVDELKNAIGIRQADRIKSLPLPPVDGGMADTSVAILPSHPDDADGTAIDAEYTEAEHTPSTLAELTREAIIKAMEQSNNIKAHAARSLNISVRTLQRKLKDYGLD